VCHVDEKKKKGHCSNLILGADKGPNQKTKTKRHEKKEEARDILVTAAKNQAEDETPESLLAPHPQLVRNQSGRQKKMRETFFFPSNAFMASARSFTIVLEHVANWN